MRQDTLGGIFDVRWRPSATELAVLALSWIAVVGGIWLAFQVFTTERVALNFITFGPIAIFGIGVLFPLYWTLRRGRPLPEIGINKRNAVLSVALGLLLGALQFALILPEIEFPAMRELVPLVTMALAVGLFEAIFFRGWMQLGFERQFGIIPGIVLGSLFYAFYHIGYGMALDEIGFLFLIGLAYATIFRFTKNIFIIWPFLTPVGGLFNNLEEGLRLPFEATYGFVLVLVLMAGTIIAADVIAERRGLSYNDKETNRRTAA